MGLIVKCRVCNEIFWTASDENTTNALIRTLNKRGGFYCEKHATWKDNIIQEVENTHRATTKT